MALPSPAQSERVERPPNLVLHLDGQGDFVELPSHVFDHLPSATIEAWVRWDHFGYFAHWFYYGRSLGLNTRNLTKQFQFYLYDQHLDNRLRRAFIETDMPTGQWIHTAAVMDSVGMKLYLNGVLVSESAGSVGFANVAGQDFLLGASQWKENASFSGDIDEVRVWSVARTQQQIRGSMFAPVRAPQPHLAGYWDFDTGTARDRSGSGHHGQLRGDAMFAPASRPTPTSTRAPTVVEGQIAASNGVAPADAEVRIWHGHQAQAPIRAQGDGRFRVALFREGPYDVSVQSGDEGAWFRLRSQPGATRATTVRLSPTWRLQGAVQALDGTPLRSVFVDALRLGSDGTERRVASTYSDDIGRYQFVNLRPGDYRLRVHSEGDFVYHPHVVHVSEVGPSGPDIGDILFSLTPPDKGIWRSYDARDGLTSQVRRLHQGKDGRIWLIDEADGLLRFDGETFETLSTDGLGPVRGVWEDADSTLWIAAQGLFRFADSRIAAVDCPQLAGRQLNDVHRDQRGDLWISTSDDGLWGYDSHCEKRLGEADGLLSNSVGRIFESREGDLWLQTDKGLSRFDGQRFLPVDNNALPRAPRDIHQSRDGDLWFATVAGVVRFDGREFHQLPTEYVRDASSVYEDDEGRMWIGSTFGLLRLDGESVSIFRYARHLSLRSALYVGQTRDNTLWVSADGGLAVYDDDELAMFSSKEGLKARDITALLAGHDKVWVGSADGIEQFDGTRFLPPPEALRLLDGSEIRVIEAVGDDVLWFGGTRGAWRLQAGQNARRLDSPHVASVIDISAGRDDTVWIASSAGLSSHANGSTDAYLATWHVDAVEADPRGGVWVAVNGTGTSHHVSGRHQGFGFRERYRYVRSIVQGHPGEFWGGGNGGVQRFQTDAERDAAGHPANVRVTDYSSRDGLVIGNTWKLVFHDGLLYSANVEGGVTMFDGTTWTSLDDRDGLPSRRARTIAVDSRGDLWIGLPGTLARYRKRQVPPGIRIRSLQTDSLYVDPTHARVEVGDRATIEFRAIDFRTRPEKRQYRYRIGPAQSEMPDNSSARPWSQSTRVDRYEWTPNATGDFRFEVQAIDRDLNYSVPAVLHLHAFLPWHRNAWITVPGGSAIALLIVGLSLRTLRQRRESSGLRERLLDQERRARQRLEQANSDLQQAREEADRASGFKSTFLANMSHEIRTPLNAILGYAQILRDEAGANHRLQQGLETIRSSGDHLLALIGDVLDLSKIEAGRQQLEPVPFDLARLIHDLGAMFALGCQRNDLTWRIEWIPEQPSRLQVVGDEGKLRQVLINLLSNAVKFTDAGGVTLRVDTSHRTDGVIDFAVEDTGPGLSADEQAEIFTPFHRSDSGAQKPGTGLGLSIASAHVGLMGSTLRVESDPGQGARFLFSVQLRPADEGLTASHKSPSDLSTFSTVASLAPGCRVSALVADDIEQNRLILQQMLEKIGVDVVIAEDGRQAVQAACTLRPDILYLDMRMPGLTGAEALQEIQQTLGDEAPRSVVVSASTLDHERRQSLAAGFDDFLAKPVRQESLYESMARLLDVQYTFQVPAATPESSADAVPAPLRERLRAAAGSGRITELNRAVTDLRASGQTQLADDIDALANDFDMDAIVRLLDE